MNRDRGTAATLLLLYVVAAVAATGFPGRARVYPLTVAVLGGLLALAVSMRQGRPSGTGDTPEGGVRAIAPYVTWILGYMALIGAIGLVAASALFVGLFLDRVGQVKRVSALALGALAGLVLLGIGSVLDLRWPRALFDVVVAMGLG